MASKPACDTVYSIRLQKSNQRASVISTDSQSSMLIEPSSISDLCDVDIDALDEEFMRLTLEYQKNMRDLRADPNDPSKKQSVLQAKEKINKMKEWTSMLNTEEGRRLLD